jgi:hypothetical protein
VIHLAGCLFADEVQKLAEQYETVIALYRAEVHSVEIIKDGHLQKVYFNILNRVSVKT